MFNMNLFRFVPNKPPYNSAMIILKTTRCDRDVILYALAYINTTSPKM